MSSLRAQTLPLQCGYRSGRLPGAGVDGPALAWEPGELTGLDKRQLEDEAVPPPRKPLMQMAVFCLGWVRAAPQNSPWG